MSQNRNDTLIGIDLETVKLSELRWHFGTGVAIHLSGTGRDKKYGYRHGVMCDLGDIREDIWYQVVAHIAQRDGEQQLVDALTAWSHEHNYTKDSSAQVRQSALQAYSYRIYDNPQWVDYVPFNRRFRPEVLRHTQLVTVIPACCSRPGEVTQEQIDHAWQNTICCPHCGRGSNFTIAGSESDPPWELFA